MRPVGVAQAGGRVANRLDCAESLMVAILDGEGGMRLREEVLSEKDPIRRVRQVVELGIRTLICGAVSGFVARMFQHHGIRLIAWVSGDAREALALYCRGSLREGTRLDGPAGSPGAPPGAGTGGARVRAEKRRRHGTKGRQRDGRTRRNVQ